jgi:endonuclease YncB( thermonuclease family)
VADGDTITLLDNSRQQHKIRLAGIDAPEKAQPFGLRSKQHLSELAFGKDAKADCYKVDRYDRDVCTVFVNGQDVGLAQLDAGLAWWFRKYAHDKRLRFADRFIQLAPAWEWHYDSIPMPALRAWRFLVIRPLASSNWWHDVACDQQSKLPGVRDTSGELLWP